MDSDIKKSLIAITTSAEGNDILNSIVSSCQSINAAHADDRTLDKYSKISALFYGEIYEMLQAFKHMMDTAGITPSSAVIALLDTISTHAGEHNIINYSKDKINTIYTQRGEDVPSDTSLIDILRGLHFEETVVNRYRLMKIHGIGGKDANNTYREYLSFYGRLNGIAKIYVGDKKSFELKLNPIRYYQVIKTTPVVALSSRDLTIYDYSRYENFEYKPNNYSIADFFNENSFERRELANHTTTLIPECVYIANKDNYTLSEHVIDIDQSILDNGNIKWLYVGIDDTTFISSPTLEGILDVTLTSVYDNLCMRGT